MLLLVNNPKNNCVLIEFINSLKKSGLYILGHVHVGDFNEIESKDPSVTEMPHWVRLVDHLKIKAFPEITLARNVREGAQQLARISGLFKYLQLVSFEVRQRASSLASSAPPEHVPHLREAAANVER